MKNLIIPLTGDDLIAVGETVNDVISRLHMLEDGSGDDGLMAGVYDVKVDILRPDSNEVVGEVRYYPDGWWAFYPRAVSE